MVFPALLLAMTVIAGDWRVQDGALEGDASGGVAGAKRGAAVVALGPESSPDRIEAVATGLPSKAGGGVNAFVLFDIERDAAGKLTAAHFAGLYFGGQRAAIGTIGGKRGKPEVIAEASCDVRAGQPYRLRVTIDGSSAKLAVDGADVVTGDLGARGGAGQGFLTFGHARFDDLVVTAKGQVVCEERFEAPMQAAAGAAPAGGETTGGTMTGGMTGGPDMKGGPSATSASSSDGGFPGGSVGPCPGLDGPLAAESWAVKAETRKLARRLHLDLLGRGPSEAEVLALAKAGAEASVERLLASEEFWRHWYEDELFFFLLIDQFRPSSDPLASLPRMLAQGQCDPRKALMEIVISQYFSARNPGNDTFVTVVMEQILGMKVQEKANVAALEAGKKLYDGATGKFLDEQGDSQSDVVKIAFGKRASDERYVGRLFQRITGAEMPATARAQAAERFAKDPGSLKALVKEWVLAPAYAGRTEPRRKSDIQWIQTVYVDLMGMKPEYRELRETRNALLALADSTPVRLVLGRVMVDSKKGDRAADMHGNPERWVKERFLLLLGREPNIEELAAYQDGLKKFGANGPRIVVRAILSSQEYQRY